MMAGLIDRTSTALNGRADEYRRALRPVELVTEMRFDPREASDEAIVVKPRPERPSEQKGLYQVELIEAWKWP